MKIRKDLKKSNLTVTLNVFLLKKKNMPAKISKINSNSDKHIVLLMIPKEEIEGWHYLALKKQQHY